MGRDATPTTAKLLKGELRGQRKPRQAAARHTERQKNARDAHCRGHRPAALALGPVRRGHKTTAERGGDNITHNTEKRITPGCNREDVSNTKSQPAARQCLLQEIGENRERRRGLKNRTRYSVSSHEEAGPICIHPCKPGTNNRGGSQTHMQPPRGPRSGRVNTQSMILSDAVKQACKHGQDTDKRVCRTSHSDVGTKTYDCKLKKNVPMRCFSIHSRLFLVVCLHSLNAGNMSSIFRCVHCK